MGIRRGAGKGEWADKSEKARKADDAARDEAHVIWDACDTQMRERLAKMNKSALAQWMLTQRPERGGKWRGTVVNVLADLAVLWMQEQRALIKPSPDYSADADAGMF